MNCHQHFVTPERKITKNKRKYNEDHPFDGFSKSSFVCSSLRQAGVLLKNRLILNFGVLIPTYPIKFAVNENVCKETCDDD